MSLIPVRFTPLFDGSCVVNYIVHPRGSAGNLFSLARVSHAEIKTIAFRHSG
jgi:hypothetical protein